MNTKSETLIDSLPARSPLYLLLMDTVVAAYCYIKKGEKHKIAIITSTSGRWIIPKGHVEKDMKKREVALTEVWEEAGIIGEISGKSREFLIDRGGVALWKIYPVKILSIAERWPEKKIRKRKMVSPEDAQFLIDNEDLATAIKKLAKKIQSK